MKKTKKVTVLICIMLVILTSFSFAFAVEVYDTITGYLDSCGTLRGSTNAFYEGLTRYAKSETTSENSATRIKTIMEAVLRSTGDELVSGSSLNRNENYSTVIKSVSTSERMTVYGNHQVWGTNEEYWGEYTTVYN